MNNNYCCYYYYYYYIYTCPHAGVCVKKRHFHSFLTLFVEKSAKSESHPGYFSPLKIPQYPLNTKMGGPQCQAGYYREKKYLVRARIQTPDHPAYNLVTVLTTPSHLNIASYQNHY
jgi:hypothetical protein